MPEYGNLTGHISVSASPIPAAVADSPQPRRSKREGSDRHREEIANSRPRRCLLLAAALLAFSPGPVSGQDAFTISTSYQNLLSNRQQTGILDLVFAEVFDRLGMDWEIVFTPTNSSIVDVNAGIIDAEANRIAGMETEYPHLRRVPEPNMTMEFVAFARGDYHIAGWESIRNLDIGLVRGWRILEDHTQGFPFAVTVPTEVELFTMLRKDRIDVALYAKLTGYATLREMEIEGVRHLEPPLATRDMYLYVHERHAALTDDIATVLRDIKRDGTYRDIVEQVRTEYGIEDD